MTRQRILIAAGILYALVAVVTFGHAAAYGEAWSNQHCMSKEARETMVTDCMSVPWVSGLGAAALWPLYWSWEAWS